MAKITMSVIKSTGKLSQKERWDAFRRARLAMSSEDIALVDEATQKIEQEIRSRGVKPFSKEQAREIVAVLGMFLAMAEKQKEAQDG